MIKCYNNDLSEGKMSMNISDLLLKRKYLTFIKGKDDLTEGDFVDFFLSLIGKYSLYSLLNMTNYMFYNNFNFMAILSCSVYIYMFNNKDIHKLIEKIIKDDFYNLVISNKYTGKCFSNLMEYYEMDYENFVMYYINRNQSHNDFLTDISFSLIENEKTDLIYKYLLILFKEFSLDFRYSYAYAYIKTFGLLKLLDYIKTHRHRIYSLELFRIYQKGGNLSLSYDYLVILIDNIFYNEEDNNFIKDKIDEEFISSLRNFLVYLHASDRNHFDIIDDRVRNSENNELLQVLEHAVNGVGEFKYELLRKTI